MNIDIFHESKSEFRQNVSAINLGRHNRQIKDVRIEHLASHSALYMAVNEVSDHFFYFKAQCVLLNLSQISSHPMV